MIEKPQPFVQPDMIFSVSDASALLKKVVETAFPQIRVRGELSQITRATSEHIYMTIKDAGAAISLIIWRGTPVPFKLEDGMEVIITGRFTTYPARSNYQIIVNEIEMAGVGAILKMLEERKRKLAAEGLFDAARKKPLPRLPQRIGVVTSPTGAAFQDIQNRLRERFPVTIVLYPATVRIEFIVNDLDINYTGNDGANKGVEIVIVNYDGNEDYDQELRQVVNYNREAQYRLIITSQSQGFSSVYNPTEPTYMTYSIDFRVSRSGLVEVLNGDEFVLYNRISFTTNENQGRLPGAVELYKIIKI